MKHTSNRHKPLLGLLAGATLSLALSCAGGRGPAVSRWSPIEFSFEGPVSEGAGSPNPFAIPFDVVFTDPGGKSHRVPGFYDGDGKGNLNGAVWKVRFSADTNGAWTYRTESPQAELDGRQGSFEVTDPAADVPEFYRKGRLEYVGERYLKFRDGGYWIKFGADEPENFLGKPFGLDNWDAKKREIDYLAEKGINCVYIMTHTLEGDGNDVWPWIGKDADEAKSNHRRFDTAKLEKWRDFFEYIHSKEIVIHLVLEDDSAWTGYDHALYYREIIARFGYLPWLYFNFNEEHNENYSLGQALEYMNLLAELDPYDHPRAIHNVNSPNSDYIDSPSVHLASIQTQPSKPSTLNELAVDWWQACLARRQRPLVVSFDEGRPANDRRSWWSVYMGGAVWESYIPVPEGYAAVEPAWKELALTKAFMETLPMERMHPANWVILDGQAFCLARPPEVYALYMPGGGAMEIEPTAGNHYRVEWFDPRTGLWSDPIQIAGGRQSLAAPDEQDWALRITRTSGDAQAPPTAPSAKIASKLNREVRMHLAVIGADAPGSRKYEIVNPPRHGELSGEGPDRVYRPKRGFTGRDSFQWRVSGSDWASNTATVQITANASGINVTPSVSDLTIHVADGKSKSFILAYTDPDGPGPYRVRIVKQPGNGILEGLDNDVTYTPHRGFRGTDQFEWRVSDGESWSKPAQVRLIVQ